MILTSQQVLALDNSILMPELSESQLTWLIFHDAMAPPFIAIALPLIILTSSESTTILAFFSTSSVLPKFITGWLGVRSSVILLSSPPPHRCFQNYRVVGS